MAPALGFEPRLAVLETVVLTVNTMPIYWYLLLDSNQLYQCHKLVC